MGAPETGGAAVVEGKEAGEGVGGARCSCGAGGGPMRPQRP